MQFTFLAIKQTKQENEAQEKENVRKRSESSDDFVLSANTKHYYQRFH